MNIYDSTLKKMDSMISIIDERNSRVDEAEREYMKYSLLLEKLNKDLSDLKTSSDSLKRLYNKEKVKVTTDIEEDITEILNKFFNASYDFTLVPRVERNKPTYRLLDKELVGDLSEICGGAAQQTLGYLFQIYTLKKLGGGVMWLDEAFSSFGLEEIREIAHVLDDMDDIQLIITEHKEELFEDLNYKEFKVVQNSDRMTSSIIDIGYVKNK